MRRNNSELRTEKRRSGFTMIELIIVIAILGILAAFALPRFAGFTDDAKTATREGIAASLNSSIAIVHAKYLSQGSTGTVKLDGGLDIMIDSSTGYPDFATYYKDQPKCQELVSNLVSGTSVNTLTVDWDSATNKCTIDSTKGWASKINLTAQTAQ